MTDDSESSVAQPNQDLEYEYQLVLDVIRSFDEDTARFRRRDRQDFAAAAIDHAKAKGLKKVHGMYSAGEIEPFRWRSWLKKVAWNKYRDLWRHRSTKNGESNFLDWGAGSHQAGEAASGADFDRLLAQQAPERGVTQDQYAALDRAAVRFERSLIRSLASRIVNVLSERDLKPKLSEPQAEAVRHLFAEYDDMDPLEEGSAWRAQLAAARGVDPSTVSQDVSKGEALIRIGLYLFMTLAPPTRIVAQKEQMNALLNAVYLSARELKPHHVEAIGVPKADLDTPERKALQYAGDATVYRQLHFPVDTAGFAASVRRLNAFSGLTEVQILELLHTAETRYALLVPGQRRPPTFYCVFHCPTHTTGIEP